MMSLFIALFMCLFNLCPSNYSLGGRALNENSILLPSQVKRSINYDNYIYIGFNEFVTYENYLAFSRNIKQYDYFPMTDVTVANFLLGQSARIPINNLDISIGSIVDGEFLLWGGSTQNLDYIEFSYDGSLDSVKVFSVTLHTAATFEAVGTYSFLDVNESSCISNVVSYMDGNPLGSAYDYMLVKFNATQFSTLLASFSSTLNNYDLGYRDGVSYGYQTGYAEGYTDADNGDEVANSIFTGIFEIGLLPVNVFLTIFNFEVFGINISGIVSGLLTMSVVVIIVRFLLGGKNDDK